MINATSAKRDLNLLASPKRAQSSLSFFKTGKGQYGFGDKFVGVTVPEVRILARKYAELPLQEIEKLLTSRIHEERLLALHILVSQFKKGDESQKKIIYKFYLAHTTQINNWDLVDVSARDIVGAYVFNSKREFSTLKKLSHSDMLWERRVAIIATHAHIMMGESGATFEIAQILMNDKEDLIHKAVGWMLREVGKRVSREEVKGFLGIHAKQMPRTMLRYALEHFPESERREYMKK